jgi:hypothetical protein
MSGRMLLGLLLIVVGVLGLAYGRVTYTKEKHDAQLGPLELSVEDKETVRVPVWAGVLAIAVGAGLMLTDRRA